jgi:hypothetical protein
MVSTTISRKDRDRLSSRKRRRKKEMKKKLPKKMVRQAPSTMGPDGIAAGFLYNRSRELYVKP